MNKRISILLLVISSLISCSPPPEKPSCCTAVTPKSTFTLPVSDIQTKEVNFLILISHALERYKVKNYTYPSFGEKNLRNDEMFNREINYEPRLFDAIKPYCEASCLAYFNNSILQKRISYISNGAQYKLLFYDKNLCTKLKSTVPLIINPQTSGECLAIGFWTFRATYW